MKNIISKICCCFQTRKQRQERDVQIIYEKIKSIPVCSV